MEVKKTGQIVLFRFPQTDLVEGKLRPALLLGKLHGKYNDWLICMISSKTQQYIEDFDEILQKDSKDFIQSGLKYESIIRISRLAVVTEDIFIGTIGHISSERLNRIKHNLSEWIKN